MPSATSAPPDAAVSLSPGMRAAFWAVTLALPVLFFLVLEGGLRLGGYGEDYPAFLPVEQHPEFLAQSRDVGRRYFPHTREAPSALHDVFATTKPENELRLFVQGGSSAAGFPFYHGAAFSRMLKWRLQDTFPDRPVEVVNTAMAAVNSFALLDLADDILRQQPDAVLIYTGHNEYYGSFGVGSTESMGGSRGLVNAYLRLRHLRTVQLLRDGLGMVATSGAGRGEAPSGSLMARMVGRQSIPYGSPDYERGIRQFRGNLSDLLRKYQRAGVAVYVATLVFNERDHEPFATSYQAGTDVEAYQRRLSEGLLELQQGHPAAAVAILQQITRTDTVAAVGFHALGRAYETAGDTAAARRAFRAASDRDALRFRAPTAFNEVIREVATAHGATVVDVEARFRQDAPGGTIGREHMLEHLHPTVDGYFLISDAFYHALLASPLLAGEPGEVVATSTARGRVRLTPADSLAGVLRVRQLMAGWPFAPMGTPLPPVGVGVSADTPEARVALELLGGRKNWLEATEDLASELERDGRVGEAIRTREAMILSYPMLPQPHVGLAGLYTRRRDLDLAALHYRAAIARGDRSGNAHGLLGAIVLERGMQAAESGDMETARAAFDHARQLLEGARQLNPRSAQNLYNLSGAYAQLGRFDDARRTAEAVLQVQPGHAGALQLLASLPR
jgi:tetratricopeptide (TPR) repeat protein